MKAAADDSAQAQIQTQAPTSAAPEPASTDTSANRVGAQELPLRTAAIVSLLGALFGLGALTLYAVDAARGTAAAGPAGIDIAATAADASAPRSEPATTEARAGTANEEPPLAQASADVELAEARDALSAANERIAALEQNGPAEDRAADAEIERLQSRLARAESALTAARSAAAGRVDLAALMEGYASLGARFTADGLSVTATTDALRFAAGGDEPEPGTEGAAAEALRPIARFLQEHPSQRLLVGGHTDSTGDETANLELSERRAERVRQMLIGLGVDADRITAVGYGSARPIASNDSADGRRANRRVELLLSRPTVAG